MARHRLLVGLAWVLLLPASGCGLLSDVVLGPASPGCFCDPTHCPEGYVAEHGCGLAGPMAGCDEVCGAYDTCAPPCFDGCGDGFHPVRGLLRCLGRLFCCEKWRGPSCGEAYWGGFISDPPDCCDPCDQCGNWTGVQTKGCVGPPPLSAPPVGVCPPASCAASCGATCAAAAAGGCGPEACQECGEAPVRYGSKPEPAAMPADRVLPNPYLARTPRAAPAARQRATPLTALFGAPFGQTSGGPAHSEWIPQHAGPRRAAGPGTLRAGSDRAGVPSTAPTASAGVIGTAPPAPRTLSPSEHPDIITNPASAYAPQLISVDDRVVGESGEGGVASSRPAERTAERPRPTPAVRK